MKNLNMNTTWKKNLLGGMSVVAFTAMASGTALSADRTLTGAATWGTAANGMVATPTAGDNMIITSHALTINLSDATINSVSIGDITGTSGGLIVTTADDGARNMAATIGSIAISGAGAITLANPNASTGRQISVAVTNGMSTGGALSVTSAEAGGVGPVAISVGGATAVTGTTKITGSKCWVF